MRKSRFKAEQIIRILRESEAANQTVPQTARQHGVSEQTIFRWRKKFGGMDVPDAQRLRELEGENQQLKKLVAERDLEIDVLKDIHRKKW